MKRGKTLVMLLAAALFFAPLKVSGEDVSASEVKICEFENGWEGYVNEDGTVTLTGNADPEVESGKVLTIPSTVDGKKITGLGDNSIQGGKFGFANTKPEEHSELLKTEELYIPDSVSTFSNNCFVDMESLKKLRLPDRDDLMTEGWGEDILYIFSSKLLLDDIWCRDKYLLYPLEKNVKKIRLYSTSSSKRFTLHSSERLRRLELPEGLEDISIANVSNLKRLNLPSTTKRVTLRNLTNLKKIRCEKSLSEIYFNSICGSSNLEIKSVNVEGAKLGDFTDCKVEKLEIHGDSYPLKHKGLKNCTATLRAVNIVDGSNMYSKDGVVYQNIKDEKTGKQEARMIFCPPGNSANISNFLQWKPDDRKGETSTYPGSWDFLPSSD